MSKYTPLPQNQVSVGRPHRTASQNFVHDQYFRIFDVLRTYGITGLRDRRLNHRLAKDIGALRESDAELLEELITEERHEARQDTIREIRDAWVNRQ